MLPAITKNETRSPTCERPARLLVEARLDGGLGRVVPDQAVALVRDQERNAGGGRGGRQIVVPAAHRVSAVIEKALVVVAKAVVVLVVGRNKRRADGIELGIGRAAIVVQICGAVFVIGHGLLPAGHLEKLLAVGGREGDMRARSRAVEELPDIGHRLERRRARGMIALHRDDDARGLVDIVLVGLGFCPSGGIGCTDKAVTRFGHGRLVLQAERDAQDVWRVRLENDRLAFSVDLHTLV